MTYDGYGTLITPFATYTNVWRVKEDLDGGFGTYTWENESPLQPILVYTIANNSFTLFSTSPLNNINEQNNFQVAVNLYPNPAQNKLTIATTDKIIKADVYSLSGALQKAELNGNEMNISELSVGMYFVKVYSTKGMTVQKFVKE